MSKVRAGLLVLCAWCFAAPAFAIDGQILINQSTVMAAGGFPYKITQPGSYKLSGNLVVSGSTDAIDIDTNNVTIDLNGFSIIGPGVCTGSGASISCTVTSRSAIYAPASNIAVRNGFLQGFGYGVYVSGSPFTVEEVTATGNGTMGMYLIAGGQGSLVRRCVASLNGSGGGIYAESSTVTENVANYNGGGGIGANGSTVTNNVANFNGTYGLSIINGVFGSNTFDGNGSYPVVNDGLSQGNNYCGSNTTPC